jgi:hypothetical protein
MSRLLRWIPCVLLLGCSTTIDANDYDRSCVASTDCVLISVGDICDCACERSAINRSDFERYQDDRGSISCNKQCGVCADEHVPTCVAGTCEAR